MSLSGPAIRDRSTVAHGFELANWAGRGAGGGGTPESCRASSSSCMHTSGYSSDGAACSLATSYRYPALLEVVWHIHAWSG